MYFDAFNLSNFSVYTTSDARPQFLDDQRSACLVPIVENPARRAPQSPAHLYGSHGHALIKAICDLLEDLPIHLSTTAAAEFPEEFAEIDIDREPLWETADAALPDAPIHADDLYTWIAGETHHPRTEAHAGQRLGGGGDGPA